VDKALKEYENGKPGNSRRAEPSMRLWRTQPRWFQEPIHHPYMREGCKGRGKGRRAKTFDERFEENAQKLFGDLNYQRYLTSAFEP
jgi:hypothetical protein